MTGIGPIEAGIATAYALSACVARDRVPDLVVSLARPVSATLEQGAVYQASSVTWRDIDASALGFREGHGAAPRPAGRGAAAHALAGVPAARLSTGADVVSGPAYRGIDADMVDMETFAVLRACQRFSIPLVGLRGISDGASELRRYDDWTALLPLIDERLAEALDRLAEVLQA